MKTTQKLAGHLLDLTGRDASRPVRSSKRSVSLCAFSPYSLTAGLWPSEMMPAPLPGAAGAPCSPHPNLDDCPPVNVKESA